MCEGSDENSKRREFPRGSLVIKNKYMNKQNLSSETMDLADTKRTDKRKQSLYFPEEMLREIQLEANRQDRSLSWIVQQAWRIARNEIMRFPSVNDVVGEDREE